MKMVLTRFHFTPTFTIGFIAVNHVFECFTCEDTVREIPGKPVTDWKINGQTAIPYGTYEVGITFSPKFGRMLPLLFNVPGFDGIRIHSGNRAVDTDGCILPGTTRIADGVGNSRIAFNHLYAQILNADHRDAEISLEIRKGTLQDRK